MEMISMIKEFGQYLEEVTKEYLELVEKFDICDSRLYQLIFPFEQDYIKR